MMTKRRLKAWWRILFAGVGGLSCIAAMMAIALVTSAQTAGDQNDG